MMRILIVEDEEHLADLLAEVLGREGHAAETAFDGRTGLTRALSEDFDLLVLDWMLPDIDGVQVVKRLRAAEVGVPVLMLTARSQLEDRVEGPSTPGPTTTSRSLLPSPSCSRGSGP